MSSIIAGRFDSLASAEDAARTLFARGFSVWDVSIVSVRGRGPDPHDDGTAQQPADNVMLAACVNNGLGSVVIDVLRETGASQLERAQGTWECGQWTDFDPARHGEPVREGEGEYWPRPLASDATAEESTGNEDPGSELEQFVNQKRVEHD
ncbi:hypothetical protein [Cupriavidus taiwanensis]|uniref:Uncharacterized protein n=1 Tax=Cupriavidus taiwanensis TaxID=164546 RepID=A0A7Z7JB79_9BURK|nr:hypothetical protein [Cupriavidus taiwanensis]SOZ08858.1 conserved hypothetical protein [Cupriavidus taiwanensis]SOZ11181.1 conserved hypothetical protein [Cupriavidus taiwanensis]SOZ42531.1 conserved hypothetical protein [Cupriavidus taiwanensis]SPC21544.1 conserved hypothetical protein [Cupriavidus taiwanensis]SPD55682.1 conserved protein of unknown function [Cupriavidus taiwanensis]